jgi:hypothetical protein
MNNREKKQRNYTALIGKDGGIEISANIPLDLVYRRLFNNAQRNVRRNPANIENGIKTIIFGCFWLEAYTNTIIRDTVRWSLSNTVFGERVWEQLKRANLFDKLDLISTYCAGKQLEEINSLKPKLKQTFELRNRLAHFKGEEQLIAKNVNIEQAFLEIDNAPDPELINLLTSSKMINEHADILAQSGKWLNKIVKQRPDLPLRPLGWDLSRKIGRLTKK